MPEPLILSVSDFVALTNQTLEYAMPSVTIVGELANLRVSKGKWLYFDLKDEESIVRFFGTVYMLPGPLEDGMLVQVAGLPRLHNQYGFSVNVQTIKPVGEGAIKRAAELLQAKLAAEGLFDSERKRSLPYPPKSIGLIASRESAAYIDFIKILNARWGGLEILLLDVQVQGEAAPAQIVAAIEHFNQLPHTPEVLVITRGGGSAEDLQAFNHELVTRAVAASRIPTLVAIGHERDISLAELAADQRGSTPSNAAELLTPDKAHILEGYAELRGRLLQGLEDRLQDERQLLQDSRGRAEDALQELLKQQRESIARAGELLRVLSPEAALRRGYAIVRSGQKVVQRAEGLSSGAIVELQFYDGSRQATINAQNGKNDKHKD